MKKICQTVHSRLGCSFFTLLFCLCLFSFSTPSANAASVSLQWNPNLESDLAGYIIHYGNSSASYDSIVDVGNQTTYTLSNLEAGSTYYIAATAYNTMGAESAYSNEVVASIPSENQAPLPPSIPNGPSNGYTNTLFTFNSSTSDPDGDQLSYSFDWGDGTALTWNSDSQGHSWSAPGTYCVKVQAKDTHDAISDWSECHYIEILPQLRIISASAGGNGTISPPGNIAVAPGSEQTFKITPNENYCIEDVLVDGNSVGPVSGYTFLNLTTDHAITATFTLNIYEISASAQGHGVISPQGTVIVNHGETTTFDLTPDKNYQVADVIVDGSSVGAVNSYTFSDITSNHSITATFTPFQNTGPILEIGKTTVDHNWKLVQLDHSFVEPVVVAKAVTRNETDPYVVRIRSVDSSSFEIRIQEWDYLDGNHAQETLNYIVMERGSYILDDGTRLEASVFETDKTDISELVMFEQSFQSVPVVIASIASCNGGDTATGRIGNIGTESFQFRMQEQELYSQTHKTETIAYIAWEPSMGTFGDFSFEVKKTADVVTQKLQPIVFEQTFADAPMLLADMQTFNGRDTASVYSYCETPSLVKAKIEEEQSKDIETKHTSEMVGLLAITNALWVAEKDTDSDGITDSEETQIYLTDPDNPDSDGDGIEDGEELTYWGNTWNNDLDEDGLANLLDPDSDEDGFLDGAEIYYGFNPADPTQKPQIPVLEVGEIDIDHNWKLIQLSHSFFDPVVIAKAVGLNEADPYIVRIRNVHGGGFEIRLQEWDYLDGTRAVEKVCYLVMERGGVTLEDGTRLEAGRFETDKTGTFESVMFKQRFQTVPVLITSINSVNETDTVTGRIRNLTAESFEYKMQEQELNTQAHADEDIAYIAWEASSGSFADISFDVQKTQNIVTDSLQSIEFDNTFTISPVLLTEMQTTDGANTAIARCFHKDMHSFEVKIEEEQSKDSEVSHIPEVIGYFSITHSD